MQSKPGMLPFIECIIRQAMKNPFPALIAYMLIQTVMMYPLASCLVLGAVIMVGWAMALGELIHLYNPDESRGSAAATF